MSLSDRQKYAATLALTIERVTESIEGGDPQKLALTALWNQSNERSATFRMYDSVLTVDGEGVGDTPYMEYLAERLMAHSVVELVIARHAEATELLALARGLAAGAGSGRIKERLRDVQSSKVMVIIEQPSDFAAHVRGPAVSGAFERIQLDEAAKSEWNKFLDNAAQKSEETTVDLGMQQEGNGDGAPANPYVAPVSQRADEPVVVRAIPASLPQPPTMQTASPMTIAYAKLISEPYSSDVLTKLTLLARQLEDALRQDRIAETIDALNNLIELESKAPNEQTRNSYGVILRRLLNGATLAQIAPYLLESRRSSRAAAVLKRGSEASLDLLIGLLAGSPSVGERLLYLDIIKVLPSGINKFVGLFGRQELQVVCNAIEVAGEGRLEAAVAYLCRFLDHRDPRVRRAALVALAKIGTPATVEPLREVLQGGAPELRALVARNIAGPQARALTGPVLSAIEGEAQTEMLREYCRALGRIGTSEAVAALGRVSEPGGKLLGRKPTLLRLAAIEGLRMARGEAQLKVLADDTDKAVREAAQQALAGLAAAQ